MVVDSLTLVRGPVRLTTSAMGIVSSDRSATLSTRVSGRVLEVLKKEGDPVKKGEVLARIDVRDLEARKKALEAKIAGIEYDLKVKREVHARTLKLLAINGASIEQSRKEEAAIANLEKTRDSLRQNIREIEVQEGYATITSPVTGTVAKRLVMAGDLAMPGKPLFKIAASGGLYVNIVLPRGVRADRIVFKGRAIPLSPKNAAIATGLAQYLAPLPKNAGVVEGEFLPVDLVVYEGDNVLVPRDALLSINGKSYVFTNEHGRAVRHQVRVVARGREGVVVSPDLAGARVLVAKPDILLRAMAGCPVQETGDRRQETDGGQGNV